MFLSKIAHEFKNPLMGISELVDIIQEEQIQNRKNLMPNTKSKKFDYFEL